MTAHHTANDHYNALQSETHYIKVKKSPVRPRGQAQCYRPVSCRQLELDTPANHVIPITFSLALSPLQF